MFYLSNDFHMSFLEKEKVISINFTVIQTAHFTERETEAQRGHAYSSLAIPKDQTEAP
jgi:hypothetical protein